MKPEDYFPKLRVHLREGGAASKCELAALEAWERGDRSTASYFLSLQDLIASGGIAGGAGDVIEGMKEEGGDGDA